MKFGAQLELYAVPEWQEQYIRYNALKRFISRKVADLKSTSSVVVRLASFSRRSSSRPSSATAPLLSPRETPSTETDRRDSCVSSGGVRDPIEQINQEFLKQLDDELGKVERHFSFETSFLIDRLTGVEEELTALNEEEITDLKVMGTEEVTSSIETTVDHCDGTKETSSTEENESVCQTGAISPVQNLDQRLQTSDDARAVLPILKGRQTELKKLLKNDRNIEKELAARAKQRSSHRQRLSRAVISIWDCLDKLEGFVQLNVIALYKILKKRDKILQIQRLNIDLQEKRRRLSLLMIQQSIKDAILRLHQRIGSESGDSDACNDIQSLSMQVQKQFMAVRAPVSSIWVPFFLGACFIFFFDILLAAILPPGNPLFSLTIMLTLFPIFRLSLMVTLIVWGAGGVIAIFEYFGVNYKFILDVDPKCSITSSTIFGLGSLLTSIWAIGFGVFLVDSKFGLFLPMTQMWIYPLVVVLGHLIIFFLPSKTFRYSYRRQLIEIIRQTLCNGFTPFGKVTLVNNIVGDVFTSLPKPLLDLEFYFLDETKTFNGIPSLDRYLQPIITLFPYWVRLIQCFSRFYNEEKDMKVIHAANMGKYFSVVIVILASNITWENLGMSIYASRLIFVTTYIVASLYGLVWDTVMDWGLMPDPDNFVRPNHRVMYPQWLYYGITLFNLVGRLTWALTLIPIGILDDVRFNASLITLSISSMEILRRSAWLVLRLENEHLTNSSRYRAMLWVPKMTLNHPEVNPYITDGSTTDAVLHQALKRFASAQVDNLGSLLSLRSKDSTNPQKESFGQIRDPGSSPFLTSSTPRRTSDLFGLLRASTEVQTRSNAIIALPPISRPVSIIEEQKKKQFLDSTVSPLFGANCLPKLSSKLPDSVIPESSNFNEQ